jgi:hypothetical protein
VLQNLGGRMIRVDLAQREVAVAEDVDDDAAEMR